MICVTDLSPNFNDFSFVDGGTILMRRDGYCGGCIDGGDGFVASTTEQCGRGQYNEGNQSSHNGKPDVYS
jgi:hypothetical protein